MSILNNKLINLSFLVLCQRTLAKYFNPCYATARLKPTFISKVRKCNVLLSYPFVNFYYMGYKPQSRTAENETNLNA